MNKFLNKYYKDLKDHKDEKFKFCTYPGVRYNTYVISNYGKIINFRTGKIIKHDLYGEKYYKVKLSSEYNIKKYIEVGVHRLVCWEYCKHKKDCNIVNHLDANPSNNYYKNLEWTTIKGNVHYAVELSHMGKSGVNNSASKFSEDTVRFICENLSDGKNAYEIFKLFHPDNTGINDDRPLYSLIRRIRDRKAYTNISNDYIFPKESLNTKNTRWNDKDVLQIKKLILKGYSTKEICEYFNIHGKKDPLYSSFEHKIARVRNNTTINSNQYINLLKSYFIIK